MPDSLLELRERRERVIARVSECYAADVLDVDELERRLDAAHGARTLAELDVLVADLAPSTALVAAGASAIAGVPSPALAVATGMAIDDPTRPTDKRLRIIMSSVERRGRWTVPRNLTLRCFWGHAELDFRDASIGPGVSTIDVRVTMANLEIILPPWLAIDVDVSSFMGSVEERHRVPSEPDPTRPLIRVVGAVRWGNLEVSTRLPGETERDARRREKSARKQLAAGPTVARALPPGNRPADT